LIAGFDQAPIQTEVGRVVYGSTFLVQMILSGALCFHALRQS